MQQGQRDAPSSVLSEILPLRMLTKVGCRLGLPLTALVLLQLLCVCPSSPPTSVSVVSAALRALGTVPQVAALQWQVFLIPYNVFLYCMSCVAGALLRFLVVAGAPPSEYANKAKVLGLLHCARCSRAALCATGRLAQQRRC